MPGSTAIRKSSITRVKTVLATTLAGAVLQSCAGAAASHAATPSRLEVPPNSATQTTVSVAPKDTDPAISNWPNNHLVAFDPSATPRHQLFLFLPGTGANPTLYSAITMQAAANGFDAVTLSYPNTFPPAICAKSDDSQCYVRVRQQILVGGAEDPRASVSTSDSLQNRLVKLVRYLDARYPSQDWARFLDGSLPRWSMIRVGGHSQGASMAAFIAIRHQVARVTLLSGPTDVSPLGTGTQAPLWLTANGVTPATRYYAFMHRRDETGVDFIAAWTSLGLKGTEAPVLIDAIQTPFQHSHVLVTNAPAAQVTPRPGPESTIPFHLVVAGSRLLPLTPSGEPLFASAWQYLCFE